jgi:hypothetical protein
VGEYVTDEVYLLPETGITTWVSEWYDAKNDKVLFYSTAHRIKMCNDYMELMHKSIR